MLKINPKKQKQVDLKMGLYWSLIELEGNRNAIEMKLQEPMVSVKFLRPYYEAERKVLLLRIQELKGKVCRH